MGFRAIKQFIIAIIYLSLLSYVGYGIYDLLFIIEPTCYDKIKNGQEEGLDCGLAACGIVCLPNILPVEIKSSEIIKVGVGDYDFVAQVYNPNTNFGATKINYNIVFLDEGGGETAKRSDNFYLLPGQTKYIVKQAILLNSNVGSAKMEIESVEWAKLESLGGVSFPLVNFEFVVNGGTEYRAVIRNQSDFDFDQVDINVLLFDLNNNIIAVSSTDVRTLTSGEQRYFVVRWPFFVDFDNVSVAVEANTNLFINSNFIKRYGSPEESFQQYY